MGIVYPGADSASDGQREKITRDNNGQSKSGIPGRDAAFYGRTPDRRGKRTCSARQEPADTCRTPANANGIPAGDGI